MERAPVYLWSYDSPGHKFEGFHITGRKSGLDKIATKLTAPQHPLKKTIKETVQLSPTRKRQTAVPNFGPKAISYETLEIVLDLKASDSYFRIYALGKLCKLELSPTNLQLLITGFEDIVNGHGDYSVGDDKHMLTFWWMLNDDVSVDA
ncbi:MAG: hypothetical protein ACFHXK_09945 [bacterium]